MPHGSRRQAFVNIQAAWHIHASSATNEISDAHQDNHFRFDWDCTTPSQNPNDSAYAPKSNKQISLITVSNSVGGEMKPAELKTYNISSKSHDTYYLREVLQADTLIREINKYRCSTLKRRQKKKLLIPYWQV